jgi:hypothetical protein
MREMAAGSPLFVDRIDIRDIRIQIITGVNAIRLLEAIRAALAGAQYAVDKTFAQAVTDDTVAVTLAPVASGGYMIRHRIVARIQSAAEQIAIEISSVAVDSEGNVLQADVKRSEAEKVFRDLQTALRGPKGSP